MQCLHIPSSLSLQVALCGCCLSQPTFMPPPSIDNMRMPLPDIGGLLSDSRTSSFLPAVQGHTSTPACNSSQQLP